MFNVPDLYDHEYEMLVDNITAPMTHSGFVQVEADDLAVSTTVWRKAARAAGRRLEVPVRTGRSGGQPDLRSRPPTSQRALGRCGRVLGRSEGADVVARSKERAIARLPRCADGLKERLSVVAPVQPAQRHGR